VPVLKRLKSFQEKLGLKILHQEDESHETILEAGPRWNAT
jgi:hypothetical protein